ncbi:MAG TPA: hypothetical protein HPP77_03520 [Candidatus Hydrogenedentes bacterium]|nr:hypothetical protein [Candidatus Hydrogenedentota bacterium]HIJ74353.1 hypothetical protein [Candidatus Hydrogenedentota bacterium]
MANLDSAEVSRLLRLDEELRAEADVVLTASGVGEVLQAEGFQAVGSYVMRTMTWRDRDFHRTEDAPDWSRHWAFGARLAKNRWVWRLSCIDAYRQPDCADYGFYWGLRLSDPAGGPVWKVDLWTARAEEFASASADLARWAGLLTDEARAHILAIKEAVCTLPEYRRTMLSVHIYEAVLDCDIYGVGEFRRWWRERYG